MSGAKVSEVVEAKSPAKNEYSESEDEDFDPNAVNEAEELSDSGDDEKEADLDEGIKLSEISRGEQDPQTTGFVRTRAQRKLEQAPQFKSAQSSSIDVDALWAEFNTPVEAAQEATKDKNPEQKEITIERTYKFAGKITTEKKVVDASSAEAREFLTPKQKETTEAKKEATTAAGSVPKPVKRGPVKRKVSLMEEYQLGKAKKLNTLQKSKLDWLGFVDKEGIEHDLKRHNKNGYLDKQGFLDRVQQNVSKSASR